MEFCKGEVLEIRFTSPTSLKASILQFCVDAFKHRVEFCKGEVLEIRFTSPTSLKASIL
ncbi:conserved hypothetical protein [Treponema phagedenis]|uniref:Uncharacterized protein n=2 Tax=Treponema phagedenis TaxID=162 RepID=A0A0B7H2P2_TREPH|nr:conserved hypothetical protein [Treponema phagedenis]